MTNGNRTREKVVLTIVPLLVYAVVHAVDINSAVVCSCVGINEDVTFGSCDLVKRIDWKIFVLVKLSNV